MKKLVALLLSVVMIVSVYSVSFACPSWGKTPCTPKPCCVSVAKKVDAALDFVCNLVKATTNPKNQVCGTWIVAKNIAKATTAVKMSVCPVVKKAAPFVTPVAYSPVKTVAAKTVKKAPVIIGSVGSKGKIQNKKFFR